MITDEEVELITNKANEAINRRCPQLERDVKDYVTRAVVDAWQEYLKNKPLPGPSGIHLMIQDMKEKNHTWYDDDLGEAGKIGYDLAVEDILKADYVATESLAEE